MGRSRNSETVARTMHQEIVKESCFHIEHWQDSISRATILRILLSRFQVRGFRVLRSEVVGSVVPKIGR
jgi:hypothetical protein